MVVDRYKGYSISRVREPQYKVMESREAYQVFDERTGALAFTFTGFYNPKGILKSGDKEGAIRRLMQPVFDEMRTKIDRGDLTDGFLHAEAAAHEAAAAVVSGGL
ncbi:MAG: hypothetical protein EXR52_05035 [Dehalococcoidia bacterium]|nr:hypothetical protein [Dehalococcoidia bacterium]